MSSAPRSDIHHDETRIDSNSGDSHPSGGFSLHAMQSTAKSVQSVEEFSNNLSASGLMTADELKSFCETVNGRDSLTDVEAFVALLVDAKKLTPYQAQTLKQGHTRGLVLGNYVILEKLGEGGMGMVFKARHRLMKRVVAIKVLPPSLTSSQDAVTRFHREVEVAAKLTHANIASAHDADQADGIHFLVMEYVEGPNLSALVKQTGPLSPPVAMNILAQAARGLVKAHELHIVHRDIKPGNLLVGSDGVVKILDMGLAQLKGERNSGQLAELTQSGRIMGTVDYMAPEQALDAKNVDQRADIYSLGCTLFYLLTGRPLAPEGTLTQKLLWHQTEPVPSLKEVVSPEVPDDLDALFQSMVAKLPFDRPADMHEVVQRLEKLLENVPPEQLQIPDLGVGLKSLDSGSTTDYTRARRTVDDRQTKLDMGQFDESSPPPVPRAAPARPRSLAPLFVGLGFAGITAGVLGFIFFAPPPKKPNGNGNGAGADSPKLIVRSSQPNARVYVDDKPSGQTNGEEPYSLELALPPGEYQVRVEKEGFVEFQDKAVVKAGKPMTLSAELGAKPATVDIAVEIPGTQVSVDGREQGQPTGKGPYHLKLQLAAGPHTIHVEAQGYEPKDEKLTVKAGESFEHRVTLADRPHRRLLDWIFTSAGKDVETPVTLVDSTGQEHTPRRWSDVPARYREIRQIDLSRGAVRPEELPLLARLETLQSLSLAGTNVDDEGAKHLADLKGLTRLDLEKTTIGDKTLAKLKNLTQLRELNLRGTQVTDIGLETLAALPLETLRLSGTMVGDSGIEKLTGIKTLKVLSVDGTRVTDEGFRSMGKAFANNPIDKNDLDAELSLARKLLRGGATISVVPEVASADKIPPISDVEDLLREKFFITAIDANGSAEINDDLLPQFKTLTRLSEVDLDGSAVTEKGLAHLKLCPTLRKVQLGYLRVSADSVQSLKLALEDADVKWEGPRDRAAAQWVIAQGGSVRISTMPDNKLGNKLTRELPANRDFRLVEIHLVKPLEMAAADWSAIKDLGDLRLLNLTGAKVSEEILNGITGCTQVQTLALKGSEVTSAVVAAVVERFPALESLYLADSGIDGASLHLLKKLDSLKRLSLAGTKLMDADLAPLATMPKLQWLSLDGVPLQDGAVEHLKALKQLKILSLDDEQLGAGDRMMPQEAIPQPGERGVLHITDAGLEDLRSHLKGATIYSRELDPERLAARWILQQGGTLVADTGDGEVKVEKVTDLPREACKILEVSLKNVTRVTPDVIASKLRDCKSLRSLDLSGIADLTDKHLGHFSGIGTLESLNLAKTGVSDGAFEKLGDLPNLRTLGLQGTLVSGAGLAKHPLPKLTRLYAGTTDFNDRTLAALKECTDLEVLDLNNCRGVTDRGLNELGGLTNLERLDLSLTRIGDSSSATLAKFVALKQINLYGTSVGDATIQQFKGMDQLEEANLAKTKVTDTAVAHLGTFKNLRRLSVYGTSVTDNAAKPLRDRGIDVNKSADPVQRDQNGSSGAFGFGSL